MDSLFSPIGIATIGILVYSAILHEIAHGYVAGKLGDPTARLLGRLTLDPRPHIDPFLSLILPLLLFLSNTGIIFGGAKPVPVDSFNLKDGRKDIALVSLAGPATNIALVIVATILFKLLNGNYQGNLGILVIFLGLIIKVNLSLAIFNLLPIPPLDGSKIFALILPEKIADSYLSLSSIGTLLLLVFLMFPIGGFSLMSLVSVVYTFCLHMLGLV
ncbi:MAG: site-2 protease family protein [Candidatus Levybacteria bacterium]|nr:site-2 protease family protein [Candidatus Levybacteria bacterium]